MRHTKPDYDRGCYEGNQSRVKKCSQFLGEFQRFGRFPECLLWVAVSMGRRNTRLKPSILVFGPDGFVGAS